MPSNIDEKLRQIKAKTDNLPASPAASTNLDAAVSSRADQTTATGIKAKTDNLPAAPAAVSDVQTGPNVVASADNTANVTVRDVVGRKDDAKPATSTAANSTLTLTGYIKALWDLLRSITWANLDAAISTRAAAATAVSNADYTTARAGKLDNLDVAVSTRPAARAVPFQSLFSASTTTTYLDALATLSGKGKLRIFFVNANGASDLYFRITVDGTAYYVRINSTDKYLYNNSSATSEGAADTAAGLGHTGSSLGFCDIEFASSIRVEVRKVFGSASTVTVSLFGHKE